jgi:glycosyltransferase involved in cell wall biosynthesis
MVNASKILFVLPGVGMGGSTTSLISILNSSFSERNNIDVFCISDTGYEYPSLSKHNIGLNKLTNAFYGDYSKFAVIDKIKYIPIKVSKQIPYLYKLLEKRIITKTICKIEKKVKYDAIVAFVEGEATRFVSHFSIDNKIAWVHCDYAYAFKGKDEYELYKQYQKIVCVSKFTREGFIKCYPLLANRTVAIHNIFDKDSVIKQSKEAIDDVRFNNSEFTILSVGRVSAVKRFWMIPVIAKEIHQKGFNFKWYIIGDAKESIELKKLINAIAEEDVGDYVVYLGGKANPYPYYKNVDLLVVLSESEACPMIFNEAKILKLPIITTDFGSAYEFVEQGKNGIITSVDKIVMTIEECMQNRNLINGIKSQNNNSDDNDFIFDQMNNLFNH